MPGLNPPCAPQNIGMCMNNSLGLKGNLNSQMDYWTVATVFEMSILAEVNCLEGLQALIFR